MNGIILGVLAVILIVLIIFFIATYNKLVKLRNKVKDQWSQIDIQLKQRFDLIPNLVETVKGYAKHEKETLTAVIEARNSAMEAKTTEEEMNANKKLMGALTKLFALSEEYPELKADENFRSLQENLKETEDKIAYARSFYNDTVMKYNNAIEVFPTVLIAGLLRFKKMEFLTIIEEEKQNVKVEF